MENQTLLATILALSIVSLCLTGYFLFNQPEAIVTEVKVPVLTSVPYNDTTLTNKVDAIALKVNEEDTWETEAKALAIKEIEDDEYEDLFDYLVSQNVSIVDKEDISKVVVKDSEVTSDTDEKDAEVEYELKVYYEDEDGNDLKVYVDAVVEIDEADVEDLTYTLA